MVRKSDIIDDLAGLAGGAVNVLSALRGQVRDEVRERMNDFFAQNDMATHNDIARLEAMVEDLQKRVDTLEGKKNK